MVRVLKRPATYDDLKLVPDHMVGEIVNGELIATPRPAPLHANAASVIGADLNGPFHRKPGGPSGPGGWWILNEPELHFRGDALVPDLAGWRRERMPKLPSTPAFELAPDWACEVLSPATGRLDRQRKLPIYARERVSYLWLVDPLARTLEVLRLDRDHWALVTVHGEETAPVRIEPFTEVAIDLTRWWPPEE